MLLPSSPRAAAEPEQAPPALRYLEARPDGLLLRVELPADLEVSWSALALLRQRGDQAPEALHRVEGQREALIERGLTLYDRDLIPEERYAHAVALYNERGEAVWQSRVVSITWERAPEAPEALGIEPMAGEAFALRWTPKTDWGALLLRREFGEGGEAGRLTVSSARGRALYIDRDVKPGRGYAYRAAYARRVSEPGFSYLVLGSLGAEVYAALPHHD